ncbi:MAG: SprT family zinc-dependent metalloprotease, partial [Pseudomonadota bacterium]|nr:SprT family zinc-dependent metalloprotease [Pseudomonadota bacterium]
LSRKPEVKLLRGRITVTVRERSGKRIKALLYEWYNKRARDFFNRRLDSLLEQTLWVDRPPHIRLRAMKTQWGSCSPGGILTLNPHLVKAPRECIDYVILHELCHLAEHNHSDKFYRLMNQIMPRWKPLKERLDGLAGNLLAEREEGIEAEKVDADNQQGVDWPAAGNAFFGGVMTGKKIESGHQ